ncbi:GDSL-type esterase/lipase family protein [Bacillus sp. PK3-056]|uniref:GDSL-type esterase/lipase family protein n=1 Tax=Niallia circulans TaxID=1397 RepID=UPI0013DDED31|nr:GDSL-type esterase/lipase family protein [Niallia circulans]
MKKYKVLFYSLLGINVIILSFSLIIVYKKGGISWIEGKLKTSEVDPKHTQRETLFSYLPINNESIVFLGDSLTQRNEWSELFRNGHLINRGIDGDKTSDILSRVDSIATANPEKIFIMTGINDIDKGRSNKEIIKDYKKIINSIKQKSERTQIIVESVLPVSKSHGINNTKIIELNNDIKKMTEEFNITYIDLHSKMVNEEGNLKENFTVDGVHLTGDGYMVWKNSIAGYIN